VGGHGGRVGVWFTVMTHESRQDVQQLRSDDKLMMIRGIALCDGARKGKLVVLLFGETDGERLYAAGMKAACQGGDDARIRTAAKEDARRHIGGQAESNCVLEHG